MDAELETVSFDSNPARAVYRRGPFCFYRETTLPSPFDKLGMFAQRGQPEFRLSPILAQCQGLAKRLKKHGFKGETEDPITVKLKRGTFTASFLLASLYALEADGVRLEDV